MRHSFAAHYRASYLEALLRAAEGDEIAVRTVSGIEEIARVAEKSRREQLPFLPEKTGEGCIASLNWVEMVDALSDEQLNALREEHERSVRPQPKNFSKAPRPTLDDLDEPGAVWGNA